MLVVFTSCLYKLSLHFVFTFSSHVVFALCLHTCLLTLNSLPHFVVVVVVVVCRYCRTFEGSWNTDPEIAITAGGPLRSKKSKRGNPRWTQNPQYVLDVVDVGCTQLYSVVLGCTRNFQYRCNYPKTESLWASFFEQCFCIFFLFLMVHLRIRNQSSRLLLACSQVLVESSETARPDRGPDFDESGDQKDGQDTNEQGQTRRKPQFCVLDHCPTGPSPFRRQEKKGHVDEFHGRTFVPPQIQKGRFQRRFQDRRGSFAHG